MFKTRGRGTARSLTLVHAALLGSVFTVPAYAQIETVVVTAERKSEDIQKVPVAVTAFTGKDLKSKQVTNFRDLQFHVPSVTYTKSNFGGAQFQIRGITTQFGLGAAISQNFDDVYLEAPQLVTGEYYDVDRVEVARGPQSTSYGRAATGGSVNIITTKPDLNDFQARVSAAYGNFSTSKVDGMVNVPIIDGTLGARIAVHGDWNDGYEKNDFQDYLNRAGAPNYNIYPTSGLTPTPHPESRQNNLGLASGRASLRWQPSDDTTVDLIADVQYENDRRVRGDKQECHRDLSGVVGCLPDKLTSTDIPNFNSTLGATLGSAQGLSEILIGLGSPGAALGTGLAGFNGTPAAGAIPNLCSAGSGLPANLQAILCNGASATTAGALALGNQLGLGSLAGNCGPGDTSPLAIGNNALCQTLFLGPNTQGPEPVNGIGSDYNCLGCLNANQKGHTSPDILTSDTPFMPKYKTWAHTFALNWKQTITEWLSGTFDAGFADAMQFTQQNYLDSSPEDISANITHAQTGLQALFPAAYATYAADYWPNGMGVLPMSNTHYQNQRYGNYAGEIDFQHGGNWASTLGAFPGVPGQMIPASPAGGTPFAVAYDEDWFMSREVTGELRLQTNFKGPLNFSAGLFYMTFNSENQYWVAAPSLDWQAIVLGAVLGPLENTTRPGAAQILGMTDFDGEYRRGFSQDRSAFLEGTWEVLPDELKLIAGARFNDELDHLLRTSKCSGGGLFAVNSINPADGKLGNGQPPPDGNAGPCDGNSKDAKGNVDAAALGANNYFEPGFPSGPGNPNGPIAERFAYEQPFFFNGKKNDVTDLWTGRVSLNWTPKLDFTTQTLIYVTGSRGELAGGLNVPNNGAQTVVPTVYKPATVDALELGTKNTLLDNTLTANLDVWYYNYENYQVGIIANRQALTLDVPARLYGLESEFLWQPTEALAFNATISVTGSQTGHVFVADQHNPTGGQAGVVWIKDVDNGSNCAVYSFNDNLHPGATTPGDSVPGSHVDGFWLPNGGNAAIDAPFGIPLVNYGSCGTGQGGAAQQALESKGWDYTIAVDPRTGKQVKSSIADAEGDGLLHDGTGITKDLHGNKLPQVPAGQLGVGAQYTFKIDDYTLVPRVDYYWQSSMEARVWNDPVIDRINAWDVMNMSVQLNAPESAWYIQGFTKNVFDKHNPTGVYLTDATSALFTNVFSEDPRTFGVELGAHW